METRNGMARPVIPKKSIYTTRKEDPLRQLQLRCPFQDGVVKRPMRQSVSDTQVEFFKKMPRNKLKRTRAEEDISSSGTTISHSTYEPRKKKRKGHADGCVPCRYTVNETMNTIYNNPKFSESRESVPNRISPPVISWSFDSYLYSQMVREAMAGIYREHSITSAKRITSQASSKASSENNIRVTMVTRNDGTRAQVVLRQAVLMHITETPAPLPEAEEEDLSLMEVMDDESSVCENLSCRRKKRKFPNHVSSLELIRLNEGLKRPRLAKASRDASLTSRDASLASRDTSLASTSRCSVAHPSTKVAVTQFPSTCETAAPILHNTDALETETTNTTHPEPSIKKTELEDQPTLALTPFGVLGPPALNDFPMNKSKSDVVPCTFLVFVCLLLSHLLNVIS